jgi:hypothetical protein
MDAEAHKLVVQALTCTLSNCVEWVNERTANRIRADQANQGLQPWEIIRHLRAFVRNSDPSCVEQMREEREEWKDQRDYWYKVIVPVDGFRHGLFVELELIDDDPDVPIVVLLNAHPQRS